MSSNVPQVIDEEAVRLTAYFLWEQDGRPDSDPADFWERALAMHARSHQASEDLTAEPTAEPAETAIR